MAKPRHDFEYLSTLTNFNNFKLTSTEAILLHCFKNCCNGNRKQAYKCNNSSCPFVTINNRFFPRPHTLTPEQIIMLRENIKKNIIHN